MLTSSIHANADSERKEISPYITYALLAWRTYFNKSARDLDTFWGPLGERSIAQRLLMSMMAHTSYTVWIKYRDLQLSRVRWSQYVNDLTWVLNLMDSFNRVFIMLMFLHLLKRSATSTKREDATDAFMLHAGLEWVKFWLAREHLKFYLQMLVVKHESVEVLLEACVSGKATGLVEKERNESEVRMDVFFDEQRVTGASPGHSRKPSSIDKRMRYVLCVNSTYLVTQSQRQLYCGARVRHGEWAG